MRTGKLDMPDDLKVLVKQRTRIERQIRGAEKAHSFQACAALERLLLLINGRLDALRRSLADEEELDDDTLAEKLAEQAVDMPDQHLMVFVEAYCDRYALPVPLRVVQGGPPSDDPPASLPSPKAPRRRSS